MNSLIDIQKRLLPDLLPVMQRRFDILQYIGLMEPVGRRSLSVSLGITERVLRSEVGILKDQNLIIVNNAGMSITPEGRTVLHGLRGMMRDLLGINILEEQLHKELGVEKVMVVSGDSDESPWVKRELGRAAANCMKARLKGENIIAVTGGSTMAAVAEMLTPELSDDLLFVPARGGIGEDVQNQANTICAIMAEKTHSKHRVLYVPDEVSSGMYQSIMDEPLIQEVLTLIKSANMVLHGIGDAITMAERRKTNSGDLNKLQEKKAVGEAFGYYFNEDGEIVHKLHTIGLQLDDLERADSVIAVAGGASKAKAIRSYMKQAPEKTIFITDEGAAKQLLLG
ncbi:sugar-binding transcriptional regulator [Bacillus dakarensis]|uniref:sugar-binding transcriptional regulator n=1 Tax=Robertmurraya dakarensis TaxID=1926278 RepID=UPI000980DA62|nr:sugar-binding domain-containing protein [Bacillus dakarensis]